MLSNPLHEPIFDELGLRLVDWRPGCAAFELAIERRHLNYSLRLHGGMVAMLLDVACGYAAMPEADGLPGGGVATVGLTVSYLAGAPGGKVRAIGQRTGGGRRIVFCSAELAGEDGALIATAQASMRVSPNASRDAR
ncbi:MAG: PaaI family thioesterase [Janthinobacterium lividum]